MEFRRGILLTCVEKPGLDLGSSPEPYPLTMILEQNCTSGTPEALAKISDASSLLLGNLEGHRVYVSGKQLFGDFHMHLVKSHCVTLCSLSHSLIQSFMHHLFLKDALHSSCDSGCTQATTLLSIGTRMIKGEVPPHWDVPGLLEERRHKWIIIM